MTVQEPFRRGFAATACVGFLGFRHSLRRLVSFRRFSIADLQQGSGERSTTRGTNSNGRERSGGACRTPIEDPDRVDERRAALGLPSLDELRASRSRERELDPEAARRNQELELEWRRTAGWIK